MKIGLLVAMEEEIKRLTEEISSHEVRTIANQTFYDGYISGQPVTVVQSGIGKVNATIATALLIQEFAVDVVINTGSAGGIGADLAIGDLVVATNLAYHDADNRSFGYTYGQIPQMAAQFNADDATGKMIDQAAAEMGMHVHKGLIVTGDSFVSSTEQIEKIQNHFPEALATEMEGGAVAQTCVQFGVPFAVVRAISDVSDEEATVNFDEFVLLAGKRSAELVLSLIERLNQGSGNKE